MVLATTESDVQAGCGREASREARRRRVSQSRALAQPERVRRLRTARWGAESVWWAGEAVEGSGEGRQAEEGSPRLCLSWMRSHEVTKSRSGL